ncbi:VOC family protein [Paracoccus alkanivorans]|uniref:Lactoylglutathione lyase n=1 Tax=Paracoccus alkanivorans TaxID=2116655 RepID=A0A3M0MQJ0_9RHOB|nr:VOC family protein [Paracoccus alkanivorans]RMC37970.1 lactoylglutathione lyase [Paracoccus alkanivorans]
MPRMIFVNLPVADVEKSTAFYQAIGATKDERFCHEATAAMMVFSETITIMLLSHGRFADFTSKQIVDAKTQAEALICLSEDSREAVDATLAKAIAAGAKADPTPRQEMGDYMYGRSFEDPDGHIFELVWMDVDKAMAAWSEGAAAQ